MNTSHDETEKGFPIPTISVVTAEDSFSAPDSIRAGYVNISFVNKTSQMHSAHLIKREEGRSTEELIQSYTDSMRTGGARPTWMIHRGGVIAGGSSSNISLLLEPGNYTWVCVVDDESVPHFAGYEHQEVTVWGSLDKSQSLSEASLTIKMTDKNFDLSSPISKGEQSIDIVNSGTKYHLVAISKLNEGSTAEDLVNWFINYNGPPPAEGVISTSAIGPGLDARINVDFVSGDYVLYCMANAEGEFHILDGAIMEFSVE